MAKPSDEFLEQLTHDDLDRMGEAIVQRFAARKPPELTSLDAVSIILRAIADPNRYHILRTIAKSEGGATTCATLRLLFDLAPPTLSHHLKELREAGLIRETRHGRTVQYQVVRPILDEFLRFLHADLALIKS